MSNDTGNFRYLSLIKYILENKEASAHELSVYSGMSTALTSGFLRRLSNRGVIVRSDEAGGMPGGTPGAIYRLSPDIESVRLLWDIFTDHRDALHGCLTSVDWVMDLILDQRLYLSREDGYC